MCGRWHLILMADAQIGEGGGDIEEFQAQISEHEATEKASRT